VLGGGAEPFASGHGRVMKEWVVVVRPARSWLALAEEAFRFAGGG
jgi:hypothetical protein